MQSAAIVLLSVLAAVVYGVLHDQVTARVCVEYFTVYHPPLFRTESPTLLGLVWGVVATWWVGLPLGLVLTAAARVGSAPRRTARDLARPVALLLMGVALAALIAGTSGYVAARAGAALPPEWIRARLPEPLHARFVADWWAHRTSYACGALGGLGLALVIIWRRVQESTAVRRGERPPRAPRGCGSPR
ncbi:MAG: hypothetical protein WD069_08870 [Planctomycetales bacterium]